LRYRDNATVDRALGTPRSHEDEDSLRLHDQTIRESAGAFMATLNVINAASWHKLLFSVD
jgi:hypothetical protein